MLAGKIQLTTERDLGYNKDGKIVVNIRRISLMARPLLTLQKRTELYTRAMKLKNGENYNLNFIDKK